MSIEGFASNWMTEEHSMVYDSALKMFKSWEDKDEQWRENGMIDREAWHEAGDMGFLCASMPEEYGGGGGDFGHEAAILLAQAQANQAGFGGMVHSGIVAPYILKHGTEEQKKAWLPKLATGESVGAIAMTEPTTGSDLQAIKTYAVKDGDDYIINGSKTFITNGQHTNLIVLACKTDRDQGAQGVSLIVVETDALEGFSRGRNLKKTGLSSQDTSELFFSNVRVPQKNVLGGVEGLGFIQMMQELPQERLIIALSGCGAIKLALELTLEYVKEREAFGKSIWKFQNTRFKLAEVQADYLAVKALCDSAVEAMINGTLTAPQASLIKYWVTEKQCNVMDECLQLFGGYGYMTEYPIARMYADARVQKIYGGTNEIMKELASRFM
ncbi:acyl-CoA dehydrogenase family protein [Psychrobacter cryohalolentis]|uniref:Acyl-[acyl-carrier-protein] dehydrogenase MbtN n=1 Tax=Psychrobacter cryohalolentis (strain ATCC BAA-1226 / DSM 17306 / VKM B-2378 / K5) TaxID=335284 RepID=Q1QAI7_PSYCK|nr:acyl-CoA dehydrogenase family protein [Psychrobacter cryohalolentis]ABE75316.1 acyl-CoA dehydrogenase-like protein [Psychrobacter cryohalolentis K5]ASE25508.1 acyl-CoA dehydrogenase [Psychrobacter cryohalolentis]